MAKAIMVQGTMSNVGKSLITAALCRIFARDGYKAAPFKAQNMALNSYITPDGLEIGRAQAMQAEAAGIEAESAMNPILLKPTNDTGSQVIVNGRPIGNMSARDYFEYKTKLIPDIMRAYSSLDKKYDIIVIEGAGSPAEINLKKNDIVNMGMAALAKAPVLLVGDIDRGGVFAQLLGTVALLDKSERAYVKAMVINKFRGDKDILRSGLDMLAQRAGLPVAGVIPYVYCDIDEEDSLTERFEKRTSTALIDIAAIRLPRISNFTDMSVFEHIRGAGLRYVSKPAELGKPDMVIIPGTKNTVSDLMWMRENGIESRIKQLASGGCAVFGICGGFQMLGMSIDDSEGRENGGSICGMGLLPVRTHFERDKTLTRTEGMLGSIGGILSPIGGRTYRGYEIHMGKTVFEDGSECPVIVSRGNIYGSYIHGIFDCGDIAGAVVGALAAEKGVDPCGTEAYDIRAYKNRQYDMLADAVRENTDMDMVYKILEEGIK